MFNYHCLNPISDVGLEEFTEEYVPVSGPEKADALLVRSAVMHEMEFGKELKAIARAGAGVNNIPLDRCTEEGIVVFNTPGANANGVKELVIAGMLLASRDIIGGINWVEENEEDGNIAKDAEKAKKQFAGCELDGKKLGVIGLGAIGVLVANAATHLGMEVYGYDPYISVKSAWNLSRNIRHASSVDEIYKECDYITVHVPATEDTKGMINREAISLMKKGVVLLNFARDVLVDEEAVIDALVSGQMKHYVTDFPTPVIAGVKHCDPSSGSLHRRVGGQLRQNGGTSAEGLSGEWKYHQLCELSQLRDGKAGQHHQDRAFAPQRAQYDRPVYQNPGPGQYEYRRSEQQEQGRVRLYHDRYRQRRAGKRGGRPAQGGRSAAGSDHSLNLNKR